jgi:hypothetical protein
MACGGQVLRSSNYLARSNAVGALTNLAFTPMLQVVTNVQRGDTLQCGDMRRTTW